MGELRRGRKVFPRFFFSSLALFRSSPTPETLKQARPTSNTSLNFLPRVFHLTSSFHQSHFQSGFPDYLSFSRWRRCYKSRGYFPVYHHHHYHHHVSLASEMQMPPSRAKHWLQKSANPALFPRMSPGSTPGMAADKCIRHTKCLTRCKNL